MPSKASPFTGLKIYTSDGTYFGVLNRFVIEEGLVTLVAEKTNPLYVEGAVEITVPLQCVKDVSRVVVLRGLPAKVRATRAQEGPMQPRIGEKCYVADEVVIVGDVQLGDGCSVWPFASVRGDSDKIVVGEGCSIQEHATVHTDLDAPAFIGRDVTIAHSATVHGAAVGDNCIIGINATILNDAEIGEGSVVGAGALVTRKMKVPPESLVVGVPGKVLRQGDPSLRETAVENARIYHQLRDEHLARWLNLKKQMWGLK